jgi:hypothetical protein
MLVHAAKWSRLKAWVMRRNGSADSIPKPHVGCRRPGSTPLCMGLFSRFFVRDGQAASAFLTGFSFVGHVPRTGGSMAELPNLGISLLNH